MGSLAAAAMVAVLDPGLSSWQRCSDAAGGDTLGRSKTRAILMIDSHSREQTIALRVAVTVMKRDEGQKIERAVSEFIGNTKKSGEAMG